MPDCLGCQNLYSLDIKTRYPLTLKNVGQKLNLQSPTELVVSLQENNNLEMIDH